ncbi:MAG: T9SS type A sorting domain-containing protein [Lentimicrobium sp.]
MKKTLLFLLVFQGVCLLSGNAQITITSADLPTNGLQVIRAVDNITQISPGNPGINQVWDFTNLIASSYDTTLYLPPQGQPNYQNYPEAEVAIRHMNGNIQPYHDYEYARYDGQGMRYVGDEDKVTIFGAYTMSVHITCNPNPLGLKLPFTYGDDFEQLSTYEWHIATRNDGVLMDSIKQISRMTITTTGDASGILSTPYGSFQALRVKNDIISEDSVYNWTPDGWVFNSFDINNYSNYRWYTNDLYEVGLYQFEEGKGNSMTFFKSETVVGVTAIPFVNECSIYPNPAENQITITSKEPITIVEIFNANGRLKLQEYRNPNLDISDLSPGLYVIRVNTANAISHKTLIKN